eukprot:1588146-Prymnesium_polylepis.1
MDCLEWISAHRSCSEVACWTSPAKPLLMMLAACSPMAPYESRATATRTSRRRTHAAPLASYFPLASVSVT